MKKTAAFILSALIILSVVCSAFASNSPNRIYADTVTVENGETVTIPVKIENNNGFMGFAVYITYDKNVFTPVSVTKGSIISGLFNDSIATSKTNTFKVVSSETSNVTADGVLFNLTLDAADNVSGKYEIRLSYSQQDTFNENWDNVAFTCEDIEVVVTENGTTAPTAATTEPTTITTTESTTKKQETTTEPSVTEPDIEETTTQPVTEPSTDHDGEPSEKPLSVRMREWVNGLPFPLNIILGIFIIPVAFIISIFE